MLPGGYLMSGLIQLILVIWWLINILLRWVYNIFTCGKGKDERTNWFEYFCCNVTDIRKFLPRNTNVAPTHRTTIKARMKKMNDKHQVTRKCIFHVECTILTRNLALAISAFRDAKRLNEEAKNEINKIQP